MNSDEYERTRRADFKAFAEVIANILESAIRADPAYRLQQIQRREKDPRSLEIKLAKLNAVESDDIESIVKDLAACRVIFYTNSDVRRFLSSDILRDNFVIDWDRTKVHHPVPGTETEGHFFMSDNVVVALNDQRSAAPEYARFRGMRCEIQVQTTLNHAWSEMEHDVYKIRPAAGFGKDLLEGIQQRFSKVMREMLIPAGYEFQKIVDDYNRLANGRELFDRGPLKILSEAPDNNQRYDLLERFKEYVLPNLDNPASAYAEIRDALIAAIKLARTTPTTPIVTPWGNLPGKTAEHIVELAADILDRIKYVATDAIESTLDALSELYLGATTDKERGLLLAGVKSLAVHNYNVWKIAGPIVQSVLVRRIQSWDKHTLEALRPVALVVLEQALRPEATGSSATYKAVTLTTAEVTPSDALTDVRTSSIALLEELFQSASNDAERLKVQQILLSATRFPHRGGAQSALRLTIFKNAIRVVQFFFNQADALTYEVSQSLEHSVLLMYRHTRRAQDAPAEEDTITKARHELGESILALRDRINSNRGFVIYKTLVGFESVFPPAWEADTFDIEGEEQYRNDRIAELIGEVNDVNAADWLTIVRRCASTRSNDLATFPHFGRFLRDLAEAKPQIVESYLGQLDDNLANFLPAMLGGLEATTHWQAARARVAAWVSDGRYLAPILWHQRFTSAVDLPLVKAALSKAMQAGDSQAIQNVAELCAARSNEFPPPEIGAIFASVVNYFAVRSDTRWVDAIWAYVPKSTLFEALSEQEIDLVFSALVSRREIDTHAEWVLMSIAKRYPKKIVDFLGKRMAKEDAQDSPDEYDAIPYSLDELKKHLADIGPYLISQTRAWHRQDAEFFEHRHGRLLSVIFSEFTPDLHTLLKAVLSEEGGKAAQFVVDVLGGYRSSVATHDLYKQIVDLTQDDDPIRVTIGNSVTSVGTVSGEFGMVAAYLRMKEEFKPWLTDERPKVRAYAQAHDLMLDRMIAAEQRRGEEDIEARKRRYGDGEASDD